MVALRKDEPLRLMLVLIRYEKKKTQNNRNHIAGGFNYQQGIRGPGIVVSCNTNCRVLTGPGSCNAHISAAGSLHLTCSDRFQAIG